MEEDYKAKRAALEEELLAKIVSDPAFYIDSVIKVLAPGSRRFGNTSVTCPFHHSHGGDMSINLKTGLWKCFGRCDCTFGNSIKLALLLKNGIDDEGYRSLTAADKSRMYSETINWLQDIYGGRKVAVCAAPAAAADPSRLTKDDLFVLERFPAVELIRKKFMPSEAPYRAYRTMASSFCSQARVPRFAGEEYDGGMIKSGSHLYKVFMTDSSAPRFLRNYYGYVINGYIPKPDKPGTLEWCMGGIQFRKKDSAPSDFPKAYNCPGFQKEKWAFGLGEAVRAACGKAYPTEEEAKCLKSLTVLEGPADVIKASDAGVESPVSFLGKEIGAGQIALIRRFLAPGARILVFLDNDAPGIIASHGMAESLLNAGFDDVWLTRVRESKDAGEASRSEIRFAVRHAQKVTSGWLERSRPAVEELRKKEEEGRKR